MTSDVTAGFIVHADGGGVETITVIVYDDSGLCSLSAARRRKRALSYFGQELLIQILDQQPV